MAVVGAAVVVGAVVVGAVVVLAIAGAVVVVVAGRVEALDGASEFAGGDWEPVESLGREGRAFELSGLNCDP